MQLKMSLQAKEEVTQGPKVMKDNVEVDLRVGKGHHPYKDLQEGVQVQKSMKVSYVKWIENM